MPPGQNKLTRSPAAFGPRTADRLYRISQAYEFGNQIAGSVPPTMMSFSFWEGVLTEDMDSPDSFTDPPIEVMVNLYEFDTDVSSPDEVKFKLQDESLPLLNVVNRYPWQSGSTGDYVAGNVIRGEYRVMYVATASGGVPIVRFQVVSNDPLTRTAICMIESRPVGTSPSTLPDVTLGGTIIDVCDPNGCFFNEPNVDLTGRFGFAAYLDPVGIDLICNHYGAPHWEVFSLCCPTNDCAS